MKYYSKMVLQINPIEKGPNGPLCHFTVSYFWLNSLLVFFLFLSNTQSNDYRNPNENYSAPASFIAIDSIVEETVFRIQNPDIELYSKTCRC